MQHVTRQKDSLEIIFLSFLTFYNFAFRLVKELLIVKIRDK
jgi:hypothetical protein